MLSLSESYPLYVLCLSESPPLGVLSLSGHPRMIAISLCKRSPLTASLDRIDSAYLILA